MRPKSKLIVISLLVALITGCSKPIAAVPSGYVKFQPSDAAFSCDAPANWTNSQFADMGTDSGGNFVSGPAKIAITSSMIGSILGDLAAANNAQATNLAGQLGAAAPTTKSPLDQAHAQFEAAMVHEHADYAEQPAQPIQSYAGAGDVSEFTYDNGATHGYRATFLGKDRSIEVICSCPQQNWSALSPGFWHVMQSITPGTGGN